MTKVKVGNRDVYLKCKSCGKLSILYRFRGKENVSLDEPVDGGVKLHWPCPKCKKENIYLMSDWIAKPSAKPRDN